MAKPPASPPSSDIGTTDTDPAADSRTHDGAKGEERARRESKGRPADTKR